MAGKGAGRNEAEAVVADLADGDTPPSTSSEARNGQNERSIIVIFQLVARPSALSGSSASLVI